MAFKEDYDFDLLHNEMLDLVVKELEYQLDRDEYSEVCRCQECILDMTAFSLNHLRPAYRSSLSYRGIIYKQKLHTHQYEQSVRKIVREAIERIWENPSHDNVS